METFSVTLSTSTATTTQTIILQAMAPARMLTATASILPVEWVRSALWAPTCSTSATAFPFLLLDTPQGRRIEVPIPPTLFLSTASTIQVTTVHRGEPADVAVAKSIARHRKAVRSVQNRARVKAVKRATSLLRRHLTPEQWEDWTSQGAFYVNGKDGEKYRIGRGWSHNVKQIDRETGKAVKSFCIHTKIWMPEEDLVLAQKVMLEAEPDRFFAIAYARAGSLLRLSNCSDDFLDTGAGPVNLASSRR